MDPAQTHEQPVEQPGPRSPGPQSPGPRPWIDRARLLAFARSRAPAIGGALAVVVAIAILRAGTGGRGPTAADALADALADDDLVVDARSVLWLDERIGILARRPAFFLARAAEEGADPPADLYYAEVRLSAEGQVIDVAWLRNLSRTSGAAEQVPIAAGPHVACATRVGGQFDAIVVLDPRGEADAVTAGWPLRARLQNRISNLLETGRVRGFGRQRFAIVPPVDDLELHADGAAIVVVGDGRRGRLEPDGADPLAAADLLELRPSDKAEPGTITWLVDTVRNLSFVGPEPIEWLEHRVFGIKDAVERLYYGWAGTDTAAEVAQDLGVTEVERRRRLSLSSNDPEIGFPPADLEPIVTPRAANEGEWLPIVEDPFVQSYPNAPPAFFQTFLRADVEREYARVYITVWDPRLAQLRIMAGTREPISATGETGPGMVPRDAATMGRLVAGFNGGFQALHGEFGMMADGRVYLPPKPWAATVAVMSSGQVRIGSWTAPPEGVREYDEQWATAQIPADMVDMRQNLTSVVEDGRFNPWERWWWGAAPLNAGEQTFIDRSGLCVTDENFVAYFWGQSLGPEALGRAMIAMRCRRGLHLDMNSSHTGFEFYKVVPSAAPFAPLDRDLGDGEYEGPVPFASGLLARAKKAVRTMTPMRFPRYIGRDPRDFFYLLLRPVLPGPDLSLGSAAGDDAEAGRFSTEGLPHDGYPYAFARTHAGGEVGARTWLVRADLGRVRLARPSDNPAPGSTPPTAMPPGQEAGGSVEPASANSDGPILAYLTGAASLNRGPLALYREPLVVGERYAVGVPPAGAQAILWGFSLNDEPGADGAVGIDGDGFLVYAERQEGERQALGDRLLAANVEAALALPPDCRLAFVVGEAFVAPDAYERPVVPDRAIALVAETEPRADVLFPDVEPRPYRQWWRMQDARVRYVREGPARFTRPDDNNPLDAGVE